MKIRVSTRRSPEVTPQAELVYVSISWTRAMPQTGSLRSHRAVGNISASAAATRARSHVRRDGPCQISAMK